MLKGSLEIWLDDLECHVLQEGDSFWFESNLDHRWLNPSDEDAGPDMGQHTADVLTCTHSR